MSINEKLKNLYRQNWDLLISNGQSIKSPTPANPMLLSIDEEGFSKYSKIILICGQETWGWDEFGTSIEDSMETYHRFFIEREFYDGYGRSAFWKAFRFFEYEFTEAYKDHNVLFIWQNLSKMGRNDGGTGVTHEIRLLERKFFPVFASELELLKPNIVLFLSGPDRDDDILYHFPDAKFEQAGNQVNLRRQAWVSSPSLPMATLRLYHPSYFRAWTHQYKHEAVDLIKQR